MMMCQGELHMKLQRRGTHVTVAPILASKRMVSCWRISPPVKLKPTLVTTMALSGNSRERREAVSLVSLSRF